MTAPTATKARRSPLGGHLARGVLALAVLDGVATSSGVITHEPRGDGSYAVYAACATAAAWWLMGRRSPLPGRPTALGRLVATVCLVALHTQAAIAAVKPQAAWPVPEALATALAIPVVVACGVALLAMRGQES